MKRRAMRSSFLARRERKPLSARLSRRARRALRNTLAASAAGNASVSSRPASQAGAAPESVSALAKRDRGEDGGSQKLVVDEEADQLR